MNIQAEIQVPGDKSLSHRAFLLGALAHGTTTVRGSLESKDIMNTIGALQILGADIVRKDHTWLICGGNLKEPASVIDAGNSGTTARILSGILSGIDGVSVISGDSSLSRRPMDRIIEPLTRMGAHFMARRGSYLPMAIQGGNLHPIDYAMPVASAQVKSCLLLAGLFAHGTTCVSEPVKSRDHTERMLKFFNARINIEGLRLSLKGPQKLDARDVNIPADPSTAAFPAVWAAATPGSELLIKNVCLNHTRIGYINVLKRMGASIIIKNTSTQNNEPVGDVLVKGTALKATTICSDEIPALIDEIPVLVIAAALARGRTVIRDAKELRVKETDRIKAMAQGFSALDSEIEELEDGFIIEGPLSPNSGRVKTFADHRIAMAFHILSLAADIEVKLDMPECVDISYPGFFESMEALK
ncbi:MAG: 3-phosphoshikimate 1-carboxyvinyltransferase [Deltaproteobacteria bacterium]|nr:3-phosphoshikimate 1-carboxyvinyltransferase [Deltaproteobacteria bacterium]